MLCLRLRNYLLIIGMHMLPLRLHTEEKRLRHGLRKKSMSAEGSGVFATKRTCKIRLKTTGSAIRNSVMLEKPPPEIPSVFF